VRASRRDVGTASGTRRGVRGGNLTAENAEKKLFAACEQIGQLQHRGTEQRAHRIQIPQAEAAWCGPLVWSAAAERSADAAFGRAGTSTHPGGRPSQSGVALRLPPHSIALGKKCQKLQNILLTAKPRLR